MKNAAGFLRSLFDAAVAAADPINSLPEYLINLQISPPKGRTIVLGAGKAGGSMAKALEEFWDEHFPEKPIEGLVICLLYTSPSPRDATLSRMPSSA